MLLSECQPGRAIIASDEDPTDPFWTGLIVTKPYLHVWKGRPQNATTIAFGNGDIVPNWDIRKLALFKKR
jgi:hypothetical protein